MNLGWFIQQGKICACEYVSRTIQVTELTNSFASSVMQG